MTENHIILAAVNQNPKRVISIEDTIKEGTCRSCKQVLEIGEPRVKVAYPNVVVQYYSRTGTPSFYMHPACYETNPVDFWQVGQAAYKETIPIAGFAVNPETDVIGYDKYPQLHRHFQNSLALHRELQQQAASTVALQTQTASLYIAQNEAHPEQPACGAASRTENSTETNSLAGPPSQVEPEEAPNQQQNGKALLDYTPEQAAQLPQRRGPLKRKLTLVPGPRCTSEPDYEEQQFAFEQQIKRHRAERALLSETVNEKYADELSEKLKVTYCECRCHIPPAERQWASPQEATQILGINSAILRSLASARAIPVFYRPSGQRVYNIPSIRKYIADNMQTALPIAR